jgi:hypothetical protein
MSVPQALLDQIRGSNTPLFLKLDGYVPAHVGLTDKAKSIGDDWSEERLIQYLYGEADLNYNGLNVDFKEGRASVSLFIGDAKHHSWVQHWQIRVQQEPSVKYVFTRVY